MKTKNSILFIAFIALMATINSASAQSSLQDTYKLDKVTYRIADEKMRVEVEKENINTELKIGQKFDKQTFEKERTRIVQLIRAKVDATFDKKQIRFLIDTTQVRNSFSVETAIENNKVQR